MKQLALVVASWAALSLAADPPDTCRIDPSVSASVRNTAVSATPTATSSSKRRGARSPGAPVSFIDAHVFAKLSATGTASAPLSGDEEFLRRVSIDLAGVIPAPAEVLGFLADTAPDKRAKKIDQLLSSPAFTDRWTMWFGDLVQNVQASQNSREYYLGRNAYYTWTRDSIASGKPYDQMVREVLAGEGVNFDSGVANYIVRQLQRNGPPQDTFDNLAAHSAEKFLGIPMLCLSCHDGVGHLESVNWYLRGKERQDFWKMAAFFSSTTARGERYVDPANPNANIVRYTIATNPNGTYRLNTTDGNKSPRQPAAGQSAIVTPAFLLTGEQPRPGEPYRVAYGRMLTADRQFARATVNLLWKEMFGRAFVEPVNAFDLTKLDTQPSHPELLEDLADELIAKGYGLRELLRTIALSTTYQLSSQYEGTHPEDSLFARRQPRRLSAEVLLEAIGKATNVPFLFPIRGLGTASPTQLPDPLELRRAPSGLLLDLLGRGNRDDVARTNEGAISQALALMNDPLVVARVRRSGSSTTATILASTSDPGSIADQLYLATLSRRPSTAERETAAEYLSGGPLAQRTEDLQFVLLNSLEFLFE